MGCLSSKPDSGGSKYAVPDEGGELVSGSSRGEPVSPSKLGIGVVVAPGDSALVDEGSSELPVASPLGLRALGKTERLTGHRSRSREGGLNPNDPSGDPKGKVGDESEVAFIKNALLNTVIFRELEDDVRDGVARSMTHLSTPKGHVLITEGDMGDDLFLVQSGTFDVKCNRDGVDVMVNKKTTGEIFGEIALMFESPRTATVTASSDGVVWVLSRDVFRQLARRTATQKTEQHETQSGLKFRKVFLNSVPALAAMTAGEKTFLASALRRRVFDPGSVLLKQGDTVVDTASDVLKGDTDTDSAPVDDVFFIIVDGEAAVTVDDTTRVGTSVDGIHARVDVKQNGKTVNRLFRGDFFGESAIQWEGEQANSKPRVRTATVTVAGGEPLVCLTLCVDDLYLVQNEKLKHAMKNAKSSETVLLRMRILNGESALRRATFRIEEAVGNRRRSLDVIDDGDVNATTAFGSCSEATFREMLGDDTEEETQVPEITLREGRLLGGGASGTVRRVDLVLGDGKFPGKNTITSFALKRMRKTSVMSTPEHIFCERSVTRDIDHSFCMKQHASFKDERYLYFLLDFVDGCDLMDALAAVAAVKSVRDPSKMFAPKVKMLRGMGEDIARHYVAAITLAFEYLHDHDVVYRDLKPENVLLAADGSAKLGDFGFAKKLKKGQHTYTFCGTPGYVAPEVVLARGYGTSVDWWGLGVMTYVLLTGQQPFSQMVNGQPEDPLTVMKRIVDRSWQVSFPVYVSQNAVELIRSFLERRSIKRLGNLRRRAEDVKEHPWFKESKLDWDALQNGTLKTKPLALSENFQKQRRMRINHLERDLQRDTQSRQRESQEQIADASKVFEDF